MAATTLSDVDALLMASAAPSANAGSVMVTTLAETVPTTPVPGGAVVPAAAEPVPVNAATVDTSGNFDPKALLWVGAGIGTAWLLSMTDRTVSGPKGKTWLVPAVILAAGAAWYFFGDKITAATASTTTPAGGSGNAAIDQQRQALQQRYAGSPAQLSAINSADATTLQRWALIMSLWDKGWTPQQVYGVGTDGVTPTAWDDSIGKWWENFSTANHF